MKKLIILMLIGLLVGCTQTYQTTDVLISVVREEINIAEADNIDIQYVGMVGIENQALLWYMTGNEYQNHRYIPVECEIVGETEYKFIRVYNQTIERCLDTAILNWNNGYAFCINNEKCERVRITDANGCYEEIIKNDEYPYVFYTNEIPLEYMFLDETGKEIY